MMTMTKTTTMTKTKIAPWFNIATQFWWVEGGTSDQNEVLEEKSLFDYFSTICSLLTNASVFVVWPCVIYWQTATCGQVKSCPSISFSIRSQIVPDQWSTLKPERLKTENRIQNINSKPMVNPTNRKWNQNRKPKQQEVAFENGKKMLDISFKVFPLKRTIPSTLFRVVPQMEYWCFQSSSFSRMDCCWKKICCFHCCRASWICPISMLAIIGSGFQKLAGISFSLSRLFSANKIKQRDWFQGAALEKFTFLYVFWFSSQKCWLVHDLSLFWNRWRKYIIPVQVLFLNYSF